MKTKSFLTHLECSACGRKFDPAAVHTYCADCNKPLLARYDYERARAEWDRRDLAARPADMWRYVELLPVLRQENIVTLGEGMTPMFPLATLGKKYGLENVLVKDEAQIPTASFKARGLGMAVSKALELGVEKVAIPTAGNAGGALAAYAARAGMECHIFMPQDVPKPILMECKLTGAHVTLVDGIISDCGKIIAERKEQEGWFDVSTLKEPYRLEGKKTMGLELAEQFDWKLPDVIIYPTGGGTGLIGMWKAFAELRQLGWIDGVLPRMVSVQSSGCDPIVKAFLANRTESDFYENAETVAAGLRVPRAFGDTLILTALRESKGCAVAVPDHEILASMRELSENEGFVACPEGAATWAALKQMKDTGLVESGEKVVLFNTGSGLKYPEVMASLTGC